MARHTLFSGAVPAAGTTTYVIEGLADVSYLLAQGNFDYGSGGTTVDAYIQTSLDGGAKWADIMQFSFATTDAVKLSKVSREAAMAANYTPTDGTLTANTVKDGLLGDAVRLKLVVVGAYVASTLAIHVEAKN